MGNFLNHDLLNTINNTKFETGKILMFWDEENKKATLSELTKIKK